MIIQTYSCDGCGTSTTEQQPIGWRTCSPIGFEDHRRAKVPAQSHLCGDCWRGAMTVVHSNALTRELPQVRPRTDTSEMLAMPRALTR